MGKIRRLKPIGQGRFEKFLKNFINAGTRKSAYNVEGWGNPTREPPDHVNAEETVGQFYRRTNAERKKHAETGRPYGGPSTEDMEEGMNVGNKYNRFYQDYHVMKNLYDKIAEDNGGSVPWDIEFETPNSEEDGRGKHMELVQYNTKHAIMRVTFGHTGKESPVVIFTRVSINVVSAMRAATERTGHCGGILWDYIRIRGTKKGTNVIYWHE